MLAAYLAVLLWNGIRLARQVESSRDYTLAGRNVPWVMIVLATTAASMIGGGASVGMVSRVCEIGIAAAAMALIQGAGIPEPGAGVLLALGGAALQAIRRRGEPGRPRS